MIGSDRRLNAIIRSLSIEDKARLAMEDALRARPTLSISDQRAMVIAMNLEESVEFDIFNDRLATLVNNVRILYQMASELLNLYLSRDRLLWFLRAQEEVVKGITRGDCNKALLTENPNLVPGTPLEAKVLFGKVVFGVWGPKPESPVPYGSAGFFEPDEKANQLLTMSAAIIRSTAMRLKALSNYATEEARTLKLDFMVGLIHNVIEPVARHDVSVSTLVQQSDEKMSILLAEGLDASQAQRIVKGEEPFFGCVFPVDDCWAVEWGEIQEDSETARRIREDPAGWFANASGQLSDGQLDYLKDIGRLAQEGP